MIVVYRQSLDVTLPLDAPHADIFLAAEYWFISSLRYISTLNAHFARSSSFDRPRVSRYQWWLRSFPPDGFFDIAYYYRHDFTLSSAFVILLSRRAHFIAEPILTRFQYAELRMMRWYMDATFFERLIYWLLADAGRMTYDIFVLLATCLILCRRWFGHIIRRRDYYRRR